MSRLYAKKYSMKLNELSTYCVPGMVDLGELPLPTSIPSLADVQPVCKMPIYKLPHIFLKKQILK